MMTGRYRAPHRHAQRPCSAAPLWPDRRGRDTLPEILSAQGYATGMFGKWHLGDAQGRYPTDQGFDEWYGIPDTTDESLWASQPGFDPAVAHLPVRDGGPQGGAAQEVAAYDLEMRAEIDMEITERTIDFMTRAAEAGTPFYAYVPYTLIHYPTIPSQEFTGRTGFGDWADCLAQMRQRRPPLERSTSSGCATTRSSSSPATTGRSLHPTLDRHGRPVDQRAVHTDGGRPAHGIPDSLAGMVPAGRESDEIVHEVDTFTTLALWAGPRFQMTAPIDGLDLRDFLEGTTETSGREGFPIYFGEELFAIKWRNFKVFFVWLAHPEDPVETLSLPHVLDLNTNPKEDPDLSLTTTHLWVIKGAMQVANEVQASLQEFPPIPLARADDFVPARPERMVGGIADWFR